MRRAPADHRWPRTEKEWLRFRERYNPIIARIASSQGVRDPDDIEDIQGKVWYVLLVKGFMEKYQPTRGPLEGFLVALVKTVCFFEADHERRRRARLATGNGDENEDRRQVEELDAAEFWMLYELADAAVMRRRVSATSGPALLRRVWAGIKNDETRQDMAAATGYSEQYIALLVAEIREIPAVRELRGAAS